MPRVPRPPVGSLEWENLGGPPLSLSQRVTLLAGTAAVLLGDALPRLRWELSRARDNYCATAPEDRSHQVGAAAHPSGLRG